MQSMLWIPEWSSTSSSLPELGTGQPQLFCTFYYTQNDSLNPKLSMKKLVWKTDLRSVGRHICKNDFKHGTPNQTATQLRIFSNISAQGRSFFKPILWLKLSFTSEKLNFFLYNIIMNLWERKKKLNGHHCSKLTFLDQCFLGQRNPWTKIPWTKVYFDNCPFDKCRNTSWFPKHFA